MSAQTPADRWARDAWHVLRGLVGAEEGDSAEAEWDQHARRHVPLVTIFGSYDAGKSSLLKRLLAEDSLQIPSWLTVGARRETFECGEAEACGCVFRDTPGLGGNARHDGSTLDKIALSDAYLLVVPPQLMAAGEAVILEIVTGRAFGQSAVEFAASGCLHVAIARMDEAGVDPETDPVAYDDLKNRKIEELRTSLGRAGLDAAQVPIHAVAADAYQVVGATLNVRRDMYERSKRWDGIEALRREFSQLPANFPALRDQALVRYVSSTLVRLKESCERQLREHERASEECGQQQERLNLVLAQVNAIEGAAKADLNRRLEEELMAATRRNAASVTQLCELLQPRLNAAVKAWSECYDQEFNKLVESAGAEITERTTSRAAKSLRDLFDSDSSEREDPGSLVRVAEAIHRFGPRIQKGVRKYHEQRLGASLEKVAVELDRIAKAGSIEKHVQTARRALLQTQEQVDKAKRIVRFHKSLDVAAPAILELSTMIVQSYKDHQVAAAAAGKRERLRDQIRAAASAIRDDEWQRWSAQTQALHEWVGAQARSYQKIREEIENNVNTMKAGLQKAEAVISQRPPDTSETGYRSDTRG
jgi:hypothetical protein